MFTKNKETVLVVGSTGRVGGEVCKALVKKGFSVFGTTRKVPNSKLEDMGVSALKFEFGSKEAMINALKESKATLCFMMTDFWIAAGRKADVEIGHGKSMIEALIEVKSIRHVVMNSVADADKTPATVQHFATKLKIEEELKSSGLSYSILRPVAFFENLDDPINMNPLKKGSVKGPWEASLKVKYVACADIAKAAALIFSQPQKWRGKTLDCVGSEADGNEIAQALSVASGVRSSWSVSLPRSFQYLLIPDLYYMVTWFEEVGYSSSIDDFKQVVPDAMGPKEWFEAKGHWANGDPFSPKLHGESLEGDGDACTACSLM